MPGLIGKKLGMSQVIQDDGRVIPVTYLLCEPSEIVHIKTEATDGYPAIVLGFDAYKNQSKNKKFKTLKEFRVTTVEGYEKGQKISVSVLKEVEAVTITASSKGRGYQGVIKRHNFSRGPETHGSHHHRKPGSVGMCAKPGRVLKGKKLPGHMGNDTVTLKNRSVITVAESDHVVAIKGPIPGAKNGYVYIKYND